MMMSSEDSSERMHSGESAVNHSPHYIISFRIWLTCYSDNREARLTVIQPTSDMVVLSDQ